MNEWSVARGEQRAIYTHRQIQPFRSVSKVPTQIAQRWSTQLEPELPAKCRKFRQSGLSTFVGTPNAQPSQGAKSHGIGTFGESRDFRHPELPTPVGTSDGRRCAGGLAAKSASTGTSGTKCRDFRLPELLAHAGTSGYQKSINYV